MDQDDCRTPSPRLWRPAPRPRARASRAGSAMCGRTTAPCADERPLAAAAHLRRTDADRGTNEMTPGRGVPDAHAQDASAQDASAQDASAQDASAQDASAQAAPLGYQPGEWYAGRVGPAPLSGRNAMLDAARPPRGIPTRLVFGMFRRPRLRSTTRGGMPDAPRGSRGEAPRGAACLTRTLPGTRIRPERNGPSEIRMRRLAERQPFVCLSARIAALNEETARSHEQEDVSAQEARAKARAWLHGPHGHQGRSPRARASSSQGAKEALRLTAERVG